MKLIIPTVLEIIEAAIEGFASYSYGFRRPLHSAPWVLQLHENSSERITTLLYYIGGDCDGPY